jgi:S1-C subfamily serine protease
VREHDATGSAGVGRSPLRTIAGRSERDGETMRRCRRAVLLVLLTLVTAGCSTTGVSTARTSTAPTAAAAGPANLEARFIEVIRKVSPSVVAIETDVGIGSGVVFDAQGDIITNAHVAAGSANFRVFLASGLSYAARSVRSFPLDDIAVLRIDAPELRPAAFGDSDHVVAGASRPAPPSIPATRAARSSTSTAR